ncbi:MAG: AMP-binding protein, partial [Anaerolineales bacterium]
MDKNPWLAHYDEGVAHTLKPYPQRTLLDMVSDAAKQYPDHPILYFKGNSISYGELESLSNALAAALVKLGVQKGERVVLLMPNSPQLVISEFGCWKAGAIAVPTNPLYTESELEYAFNECGAETVIVLTTFYEKVKAVQSRTKVQRVIATNIKEFLTPLMKFLFTLLKEKKEGHRVDLQAEDFWFEDLLKEHAGAARPPITVNPDDAAIFLFSG